MKIGWIVPPRRSLARGSCGPRAELRHDRRRAAFGHGALNQRWTLLADRHPSSRQDVSKIQTWLLTTQASSSPDRSASGNSGPDREVDRRGNRPSFFRDRWATKRGCRPVERRAKARGAPSGALAEDAGGDSIADPPTGFLPNRHESARRRFGPPGVSALKDGMR